MKTLITVVVILVVVSGLFALKHYGYFHKYTPGAKCAPVTGTTPGGITSGATGLQVTGVQAIGNYVNGKCV